jgi:hypothetical protein
MEKEEIISLLEDTGAIQHGHFILSSGKRSGTYCQCAKLFVHPEIAEKLCIELASKVKNLTYFLLKMLLLQGNLQMNVFQSLIKLELIFWQKSASLIELILIVKYKTQYQSTNWTYQSMIKIRCRMI